MALPELQKDSGTAFPSSPTPFGQKQVLETSAPVGRFRAASTVDYYVSKQTLGNGLYGIGQA